MPYAMRVKIYSVLLRYRSLCEKEWAVIHYESSVRVDVTCLIVKFLVLEQSSFLKMFSFTV